MDSSKKIKNLLVTEDDKILIRFYEQALESICEYHKVAGTSHEALEVLGTRTFDFLITDLNSL